MDNDESVNEFDLEEEEGFCTSYHTILYLGALDLVESYYLSLNSKASNSRKKIKNFIHSGKKFVDRLLEGFPMAFHEHCFMDQDVLNLLCHCLKEEDPKESVFA